MDNTNVNTGILVVAGETSGDLHGSSLLNELRQLNPDIHFFGVGGDRMGQVGMTLLENTNQMAVIGFTGAVRKYGFLRHVFKRIIDNVRKEKPARAIVIDYPGFNLRLVKKLKRMGVPVTYFISPQLWAWREKRIEIMRECVDQILCIFPFEEQWYRERGVDATFVGHPSLDRDESTVTRSEFFGKHGLKEDAQTIALLPGSRQSEVKRHLPIMMESIKRLVSKGLDIQGIIGKAPAVHLEGYKLEGTAVERETPQLALHHSDVAIVASGTASLEAALHGRPTVVIYRLSWANWWLAQHLAKVDFMSMTNLVAQREILPELLQRRATPENIADAIQKIMESVSSRENMIRELAKVRTMLGSPGATRRAAELINTKLVG